MRGTCDRLFYIYPRNAPKKMQLLGLKFLNMNMNLGRKEFVNQQVGTELASDRTPFSREVHLADYFNIVRKRKWMVIASFFVIVGLVSAWSFSAIPVYKATTQIMIESQHSFINKIANASYIDPGDEAYYLTQYRLLMSRSLAKRVIEDLGLWKNFSSPMNNNQAASSSPEVPVAPHMVNWYLSLVQIEPIRGTKLVNVSVLHQSPEMAARIANAHAYAFIARSTELQHKVSEQALEWLKKQIHGQKTMMGASQRSVYEFKYEQLGSFSVDDESVFSIPEIKESSVIRDLRGKLAEFKAKKSEMATKYGPKHPRMIEINSSIQKQEEGIIDEVQTIRMAVKAELDRIIAFEKKIQSTNVAQPAEDESIAQKAITYNTVRLEAESDQEIYDVLLKHAKEIGLTGSMEKNNIRVVDEAELPLFPVKPQIFMNILLSIFIGTVFGTGVAFFLEYMDRKIRTSEDVLRRLGLPVIGIIPYDKLLKTNKLISLTRDESYPKQGRRKGGYAQYHDSDLSNRLIAKMPFLQSSLSGQSFMVESAFAGEGKTTVLAKMAISLSQRGVRVIMVDADLQRPSLHDMFGFKNGKGGGLLNVMNSILSREIREGTLDTWSIDDLFCLIALKKQSGMLVVSCDDQNITAVFEQGRLIHLQNKDNSFANRLGNMLLRGGFITEDQLSDALERNQRTGLPLGYILINSGYVNRNQLQGPLKLQKEEFLQKLFSWKHGTFIFEPGSVETYEDKRIYFEDDCTPVINRLGQMSGSRFLEREMLSYVKPVNRSNLSILPAGVGKRNLGNPACFALMSKFLALLKQRFDVVLVDAPPVLDGGNNATPLFSLVDGVIFVIKAGQVSDGLINKAVETIKESKANIVGAVLNRARIERGSYY